MAKKRKQHPGVDPEELNARALTSRIANEKLAAAAVKIEGDRKGWSQGKRYFRTVALTAVLNKLDGVSLEGVEHG